MLTWTTKIRPEVKQMIKTCLLGLGRTGRVVAEELLSSREFDLISVIAGPRSRKINKSLREIANLNSDLLVTSSNQLREEIRKKKFSIAIDFSSPEACLKNAQVMAENGIHMVVGTTGFNKIQIYELKNLVQRFKIGLVYAPNISVGINVLLFIAKSLAKLVPEYDVEIMESHHRHKVDSPSGTAIKIATEIHNVRGEQEKNNTFGRKGSTQREKSEIGIHAVRAGGITGVHQVLFAGEFDEIEITHRSYSRKVFAAGALTAAKFIRNRKGFFSMEEVLSYNDKDETEPIENWA
jgi:4-hydroxy-tetrahydrodipicolinate reductase